jgi:ribosome biogenesis SPOUT family RNA methylase Rps3
VSLGNHRVVKATRFERIQFAEVVDVDFAVDFGSVKLGSAFPQERRFFALAFGKQD